MAAENATLEWTVMRLRLAVCNANRRGWISKIYNSRPLMIHLASQAKNARPVPSQYASTVTFNVLNSFYKCMVAFKLIRNLFAPCEKIVKPCQKVFAAAPLHEMPLCFFPPTPPFKGERENIIMPPSIK